MVAIERVSEPPTASVESGVPGTPSPESNLISLFVLGTSHGSHDSYIYTFICVAVSYSNLSYY